MLTALAACAFVVAVNNAAHAETVTVHIKDGSVVSGTIVHMDQSVVELKLSYGTVTIHSDRIESIDYGNGTPGEGEDANSTIFYNDLSPYGRWVFVPPYGYVWYPASPGPGWMPYVNGHWIWTDAGWTWVSYEPWGWATYHYGYWNFVDTYGWVWVPGTVWGPAWVVWYGGPGYIGWAPRPWGYWAGYRIPWSRCVFVHSGAFMSVHIGAVAVPRAMNPGIVSGGRVSIMAGHGVYGGPSVVSVRKYTGVNVRRFGVVGVPNHINRIQGGRYYIYRPAMHGGGMGPGRYKR